MNGKNPDAESSEPSVRASTLAIIGAGPKAIAIAAKRAMLQVLGWSVPDVVIIDRHGIATGWSGEVGMTDGRMLLGTPPEKDVGFPYSSACWAGSNGELNAMMTSFSWQTYLIHQGKYSSWINRGRPQPPHSLWADYLRWVAELAEPDIRIATVDRIGIAGQQWSLECESQKDGEVVTSVIRADGLVITGPGTPRVLPGQPRSHPRVLDGRSYWKSVQSPKGLRSASSVAVVGAGETAAAVILSLLDVVGDQCAVDIVSPSGFAYLRGESFQENRPFSDPGVEWLQLSRVDRREFISRTDRGVMSPVARQKIDLAENVRMVPGLVVHLHAARDGVELDIQYNDRLRQEHYDYVVVATGFDPLWFTQLLDEPVREELYRDVGGYGIEAIESGIGHDLSIEGLEPALHLPMLAGLTQGPGFPNLSCLGLLSDRILETYVTPGGREGVQSRSVETNGHRDKPEGDSGLVRLTQRP